VNESSVVVEKQKYVNFKVLKFSKSANLESMWPSNNALAQVKKSLI